MLAMRLSVVPGSADAMREYLNAEAFPRAMKLTGVVACHLFAADDRASFVDTAESSSRKFDVPSWVLLSETTFEAAAESARSVFASAELHRLGVSIRNDAAIYALEICRVPSRGKPS